MFIHIQGVGGKSTLPQNFCSGRSCTCLPVCQTKNSASLQSHCFPVCVNKMVTEQSQMMLYATVSIFENSEIASLVITMCIIISFRL